MWNYKHLEIEMNINLGLISLFFLSSLKRISSQLDEMSRYSYYPLIAVSRITSYEKWIKMWLPLSLKVINHHAWSHAKRNIKKLFLNTLRSTDGDYILACSCVEVANEIPQLHQQCIGRRLRWTKTYWIHLKFISLWKSHYKNLLTNKLRCFSTHNQRKLISEKK